MSTQVILIFAIGVFVLMGIGIGLTIVEFERLQRETATRKAREQREKAQRQPTRPHNLIDHGQEGKPSKGSFRVVEGSGSARKLQ